MLYFCIWNFRIVFSRSYILVFKQRLKVAFNCWVPCLIIISAQDIHVMMFWRNCWSCQTLIVSLFSHFDLCSLSLSVSCLFPLDFCCYSIFPFPIVLIWLFLKMLISQFTWRIDIMSVRILWTLVSKIRLLSQNWLIWGFILNLVIHLIIVNNFINLLFRNVIIVRRRKKFILKFKFWTFRSEWKILLFLRLRRIWIRIICTWAYVWTACCLLIKDRSFDEWSDCHFKRLLIFGLIKIKN